MIFFCKIRHTYQTMASLVAVIMLQVSMCAVHRCVVLLSHVMSLAPCSSLAIGVDRSQSLHTCRRKAE